MAALLLNAQRAKDVATAARLLCEGGVVALPTETVYGLATDGLDPRAVARVFAAKGRPTDNPVILHVGHADDAKRLWRADLSPLLRTRARRLAVLWPGPLTLVLPAAPTVPAIVTAGLPTVAVRVPAHPVALAVLGAVGRPLAAPSANASGRPSPTRADHVVRTLGHHIDAVLDGGPCAVGVESTVVDLSRDVVTILRPGALSAETLSAAVGEPVLPYAQDRQSGASPGLRHRHYAPAIDDVAFTRDTSSDWHTHHALLLRETTAARLTAAHGPRAAPIACIGDTPSTAARDLYAALYRLEALGVPSLRAEPFPSDAAWDAVRDRLRRAVQA